MKVILAGGRGFIGSHLLRHFSSRRHEIVVLSRKPETLAGAALSGVRAVGWDAVRVGPWAEELANADVVINLAGENIGRGLWTARKKRKIQESRKQATAALVEALMKTPNPPKVLLNASAVGYYGPTGDEELTEDSPPGHDFLAETCIMWEAEAEKAKQAGARVVFVRIGLVLARDGGMFPLMALPFRLMLGGRLGSGKQWMSWIHIDDLVSIFDFLIQQPDLGGPVNATAPNPVTNATFTRLLARALHRPAIFHVPAFAIRLLLREQADLLLRGQRVVPARLLQHGFRFAYPTLEQALTQLV